MSPDDLPALITRKIQVADGGCWQWVAATSDGYGLFSSRTEGTRLAHRVVYGLLVGEVAGGMTLDHQCHSRDTSCRGGAGCMHRRCVNPEHLKPMSIRDNLHASPNTVASIAAAKTECKNGHPFTPENTMWRTRPNGTRNRNCRACQYASNKRRLAVTA